jgi:hypothetical protein
MASLREKEVKDSPRFRANRIRLTPAAKKKERKKDERLDNTKKTTQKR